MPNFGFLFYKMKHLRFLFFDILNLDVISADFLMKNIGFEKKVFYIFLLAHLVIWASLGLIRTVLPTDALEGIYWGNLFDFGTPKHPPLFGWLSGLVWWILPKDISIYFISQLFIIGGFFFIYKLARKFLDEAKSILSVIILEGCWVYSYITCYYGFNPDVIMLFMLPVITYYFYKCMYEEKNYNWLILGLLMGLSLLNKYQSAFLVIPMALWAILFKKETFKNKYFYISILIATIVFLPHLFWLFKYDFFPFLYFKGELSAKNWFSHISAPLVFTLVQISLIIGSLAIFFATKLRYKIPLKIPENCSKKDFYFILSFASIPILLHLIMACCSGEMRPRWGFEFWYMTGIFLFYFVDKKTERNEFMFALKTSCAIGAIIFVSMFLLLALEKNYRSRYPVSQVFGDLKEIWAQKYDTPLKYLGGYIEWTLPLSIYGDTHPKILLDTFWYKDPWVSEDELIENGLMIIDRKKWEAIARVRKHVPSLPMRYKVDPKEYSFKLHNAFGAEREYKIYYFIVPKNYDKINEN